MEMTDNAVPFGSVYAGLVSNREKGRYRGVLAESWEASPDMRRWVFRLRRDMRFETGEPVTSEDLARSWLRLERMARAEGTRGLMFDLLEGYSPAFPGSVARGLRFEADSVTLSFREPYPELLATLSDPMYAVVHRDCWDASDAWRCEYRAVASGPYRVARWDDHGLELALRPEFPKDLRHERAPDRIRLLWDKKDRASAELVYGSSRDDLSGRGYRFMGGMDSSVAFVACRDWAKGGTLCADRAARAALRHGFYRELGARGLKGANSFFPLTVPGIKEFPETVVTGVQRRHAVIFHPMGGRLPVLAETAAALGGAARGLGWGFEIEERKAGKADVCNIHVRVTDIPLDQPERAIRLMFLAKSGARLPDPTGRAAKELKRKDLDLQALNAVLWDDAVVWPLAHFAWGTWAKEGFDFSKVNLALTTPALHWIGADETRLPAF